MQAGSSGVEGKCFCCLVEGKHQHAIQYLGMLRKCLNLIVMPTWEKSLPICVECVSFVNKVETFREMILTSQAQLQEALRIIVPMEETICNGSEDPDKTDMKEEDSRDFLEVSVAPGAKDEMATYKSENGSSTDGEYDGLKEEHTGYKTEMDSDTDEDYEGNKTNTERENRRKTQVRNKRSSAKTKLASHLLDKTKRKIQKMDRHRIRSNIVLILYHSTIVPFSFPSTFKCFYCPKKHFTFTELREHNATEHSDETEATIIAQLKSSQESFVFGDISCIQCKICQEKIDSIENLIEHLQKQHDKTYFQTTKNSSHGVLGFDMRTNTPKCHICQKEFAYFRNLKIHMNEHYGYHVCYVCGKQFMSELRHANHVKNYHENKETKCKFCNKVMKSTAKLIYHINKDHHKREVKCLKCPKTFPFGQYMQRIDHMAKEHGLQKPVFKCDICNKEYARSSSLNAHQRYNHKRSKEFKCDICGYVTTNSTCMSSHMNMHNGVKKYECSICNKKLASSTSLSLHIRMHMNDKRFACTLCDAAFIQKHCLKSHYKSKHPDIDIDIYS